MKYNVMDPFRFDLTEEQRRLCDWIARQARTGPRRIRYDEAKAAWTFTMSSSRDVEAFCERLERSTNGEAQIVNTWTPVLESRGGSLYLGATVVRERADSRR